MRQIGNYLVDDTPLGSGGMGSVYRGTSLHDNSPVAVKEILPQFVSDIEYRSRIESEIAFLKRLRNDNIVKIYDSFELNGKIYIVMELVQGLNLEQYVNQYGRLEWQKAIPLMIQLLGAIQHVHENGIIHRDIKPGNVMLRPDGTICLLDFGVAKDTSHGIGKGRTVLGTTIGTDGYMSPEQAQGLDIDSRSDIYGLGCVLYFMLTGTHAYGLNNGAGYMSELTLQNAIINQKFPKLSDKVKGIPSTVQDAVFRAVEKNMMKRFQSCREFSYELQHIMSGGTQINSGNRSDAITLSVGREGCDIIIGETNLNVSRHHADIKLKNFTGGMYYVFTDTSSNGTSIDGTELRHGMTYNIRAGERPQILLAPKSPCRLDMALVEEAFRQRINNLEANEVGVNNQQQPISASQQRPIPGAGPQKSPRPGNSNPKPTPRQGRKNKSNTFFGAIGTCFSKYATFTGRATRAEYWWFVLFTFLVSLIINVVCQILFGPLSPEFLAISLTFSLAFFLPSLAVTIRRLHDTGRRGWYILMGLIPLAGGIILLIYMLQESNPQANRFGAPVN